MQKKKYYETQKFLKQRNAWYDKLKKSGFKDLEYVFPDGQVSNSMLTVPNNINGHKFNEDNYVQWSNKERYYDFARSWIWDKPTKWTKFKKQVWEMHAEGSATLDIHKQVNAKKRKHKISKGKIEAIIKEQRDLMLKHYIQKNRVDLQIVYDDDDGDQD